MLKLWENNIPGYNPDYGNDLPGITPYLLDDGKMHGAVVVCPGGGYGMKADHEGDPVARWLNKAGVSAFVLNYRVAPYKHPYPLMDAQRALRYVRCNAEKWHINPNKIGILGFSAGGHLASAAGTHFDDGIKDSPDPVERVSCRPDAMILCYPVVTFGDYRHEGSMLNLIGGKPVQDLRDNLSNEKMVSKDTPPAFIWHTSDDQGVPVENSLLFAGALSRYNINFELHVFPEGRHGLGLAESDAIVSQWTSLCEKWLKGLGFVL